MSEVPLGVLFLMSEVPLGVLFLMSEVPLAGVPAERLLPLRLVGAGTNPYTLDPKTMIPNP